MTQHFVDPTAVLGMARRDGRQMSFRLVLTGAASLVAALLVATMGHRLGLLVGLVVLAACAGATYAFHRAHPATLRRWAGLLNSFWSGIAATLVLLVLGALVPHAGWLVWVAGALGLLSGLAVGHFVFHGANALEQPSSDTARH